MLLLQFQSYAVASINIICYAVKLTSTCLLQSFNSSSLAKLKALLQIVQRATPSSPLTPTRGTLWFSLAYRLLLGARGHRKAGHWTREREEGAGGDREREREGEERGGGERDREREGERPWGREGERGRL